MIFERLYKALLIMCLVSLIICVQEGIQWIKWWYKGQAVIIEADNAQVKEDLTNYLSDGLTKIKEDLNETIRDQLRAACPESTKSKFLVRQVSGQD